MVVKSEHIRCSEDLPGGVTQFISGQERGRVGEGDYLRIGSIPCNPLKHLSVDTQGGSLLVSGGAPISNLPIPSTEPEEATHVHCLVTASRFVSQFAKPAKYFVIPLFNFLSEFCEEDAGLRSHPLRVNVESESHMIVFRRNASLAFIEPLPDYQDRRQQLVGKKTAATVTAVLVGDLTEDESRDCKLRPWTAERLLQVLSFATGTFVGAPWVEYRDGDAGLVARDHMVLGRRDFEDGHGVIREAMHRGIGHLITAAMEKFASESPSKTMAMVYAVKAGIFRKGSVEDLLRAVVSGLECLFTRKEIKGESLLSGLENGQALCVRDTLKTAEKTIREFATSLVASREPADKIEEWRNILRRIADKVRGVDVANDFGRKVHKLLQAYGLPDADLAEKYFADSGLLSEAKAKSWYDLIGKYRNMAAHTGYFEFAEGKYDKLVVRSVADHLHDIVIRSVLIDVGYKGTYQTPLSPSPTSVPVNWLTQATFGNVLGRYKSVLRRTN